MKKRIIALAILVVSAAGGYTYYRYTGREVPPQIATAPITRGDVVVTVGATGTLEAVTTVQVGTQVSGTIQALYADFNSVVRKGQVIARLDPSLLQTQIEQARANLLRSQADVDRLRVAVDDAQSKLKRAEELAEQSLIPRQDLETAQLNVRSAVAQLQSAQAAVTQARATLNQNDVNLQHTVIEAPIDGIVISRNVDVGQTVAASMQAPTLFVIAADLTKMRVNANVDEADVGQIRPNQRAIFRVDAFPTEEFVGRVSQIRLQPQVVQNVVTYNTVIEVPNPAFKLKPGMTANVNIEIARRENVLRIPNAALRFRPTPEMFAALGQPVPPELQGRPDQARPQLAAKPGSTTPDRAGNATPADGAATTARGPAGSGNGPSRRGDVRAGSREPGTMPSNAAGRSGAGQWRSPDSAGRSGANRDAQADGTSSGAAPRWQQAATVDAMFGPLPTQESSGRAWRPAGGRLEMIALRLGVADTTYTEILRANVEEGDHVVTSMTLPGSTARPQTQSQSPLIPSRRGGGPPGVRNASPAGR